MSHRFSWGRAGFRIYRRAVGGSLLSYHGDFDPLTGQTYGAARGTGGELTGSLSLTDTSGFWGNLRYEQIRGTNIADNHGFRLMGGYY